MEHPETVLMMTAANERGELLVEDTPLQMVSPSVGDPSRAPAGYATVKIEGSLPYALKEGPKHWDNIKDQVAEKILARLQRVAPNLTSDKVLAKFLESPIDIERMNPGDVARQRASRRPAPPAVGALQNADSRSLPDRRVHSSGRVDHRHSRDATRRRRCSRIWVRASKKSGEGSHDAATCLIMPLLFLGFCARAQQAAAKQEVPDNVAEHAAPATAASLQPQDSRRCGLQCQQCHTNPEPGSQMTFPASTTCMTCHNTRESDAIGAGQAAQPIPWVRVYQVTPGVIWTHSKHLQAGMQCVMCHGNVAQLDAMAETTSVTSMASCISCHQRHNASTDCATCHAWPTRS